MKPLAQLLNNVARDTEKVVLGELERSDPALATAVRDLMFVFEDITHLDDRGLQEVLRLADTRTIASGPEGCRRPRPRRSNATCRSVPPRTSPSTAQRSAWCDAPTSRRPSRRSSAARASSRKKGRIVLMRGGGGGGDFI